MARSVTYCTPKKCSNHKSLSENSRICDTYPSCKCRKKKICKLHYSEFDKFAALGQKRRAECGIVKLQDPLIKTMLASQNQNCLVIKLKEQKHKKTPNKSKCKVGSSCISRECTAASRTTTAPAQAAFTKPTKNGFRLRRLLGMSQQPRTWSLQDEAPLDMEDTVDITNDLILTYRDVEKCPGYEYCLADNPELQYQSLMKCADALRMKEKQLQLKEKEIKKKNKILRKRMQKFRKKGNAREKADLRAARMMEFARDKLLAFQSRKDKIVKQKKQKHYEVPKCLQACGDTFTAKGAQCKDKCRLKSRLMPSILMPCLCKSSGKGDQPLTCRGSCVKRLLGLSNGSKPCLVRKPSELSYPFRCMVKANEMMQSRKMRNWTTAREACQPTLTSPPPYQSGDPKFHWKRLGYLLLCLAGVVFWVPVLICLQCLSCCCYSE